MGMIGHKVIIGGSDVSQWVLSCEVDQEMATESDPAKVTVRLADTKGYFDAGFRPQVTEMVIILYYIRKTPINASYSGDSWSSSQSQSKETYPTFFGMVTDCHNTEDECIVNGSCTLEHLSDALSVDINLRMIKDVKTDAHVLETVTKTHNPQIPFKWKFNVTNMNEKNYKTNETYQDVWDDIRIVSGSFIYTDEFGTLMMNEPKAIRGSPTYMQDIKYYVTNSRDANSVMGYHNIVTVIADGSLMPENEPGAEIPYHAQLAYTYPSQNPANAIEAANAAEAAAYGPLDGPVEYNPYLKTLKQVRDRAEKLWYFYRTFENALTTVVVVAKAPFLHSFVKYAVKSPNLQSNSGGSPEDTATIENILNLKSDFLREMFQNSLANSPDLASFLKSQGFDPEYKYWDSIPGFVSLSGWVKRKQVEYSGQDFITTLTLFDPDNMENSPALDASKEGGTVTNDGVWAEVVNNAELLE